MLWLLLQRCAGRNSWHPGETSLISPEHCGSVSLWCLTPGPHHTSPAQPPLASVVVEDLFQDRGLCVETYAWCRSFLSTRSMLTTGTTSPPPDNIRVMVIVWRLRGNIIRTALCWIVWHNVHSPQHTYVSSSYRSNRLGLSHWDP